MLAFSACNDRLICSAYSSYFVLDNANYPREGYPKDRAVGGELNRFDYPDPSYHLVQNPIREEYFAYISADSTPQIVSIGTSDQFGVAQPKNLRARERGLGRIPMEVVIPQAPDSILFGGDEELLAEMDLVDSLAVDSARSVGKSYQYNLDQKYYLWYHRNKLVWKDELEAQKAAAQEAEAAGTITDPSSATEVEGGKEGFFKRIFGNLFKKKEKPTDPAIDGEPSPDTEEPEDGF